MDKKQIKEAYKKYADSKGFKLNPDKKIVDIVITGLLRNEKNYGFRYCPCRPVTRKKKEDKPKICPCKWHKEEIEKDGHCKCWLFFRA